MERSDEDLVRFAAAGDRSALEDLLGRHHDRIWSVCRRITGNDADAADATQEALLAIVRGLDRFDGRASFRTWSYRVATNACLDELRRRRRRPEPTDLQEHEPPPPPTVFEDRLAEGDRLSTALAELDEKFRIPVILRDVYDLDYAEISETLGIPPGTVRSRIARGRGHLAELLGTRSGSPDVNTDDHA